MSDSVLVRVDSVATYALRASKFIELWDDMLWSDLTSQITEAMKMKDSPGHRYLFVTKKGVGYVENIKELKLLLKYKEAIEHICFSASGNWEERD